MTPLQPIGIRLCLLACSVAVFAGGCDETGPRVYTAQRYSPDPACLESYIPIGLVQADTLDSTCEPTCLRVGDELYISPVCAPYPLEASVESPEQSPDCSAAQALYVGAIACETEGPDAGPEP